MDSKYQYRVILVGCGKMGGSILRGLLTSGLNSRVCVVNPEETESSLKNDQVFCVRGDNQIPDDFNPNMLLFAVKPQVIGDIVNEYKYLVTKEVTVMSILAGTPVKFFQDIFGDDKQIVRLMPNLGATYCKSTTFAYSSARLKEKSIIEDFIRSFGKCIWLDGESKMHQATAVAGSGPAYYFLFFKYFAEFLIESGFGAEEAKNVALNTCDAALSMAKEDMDFDKLMGDVTSPNGTTYAALQSFKKEDRLRDVFSQALMAATNRSKELSGE